MGIMKRLAIIILSAFVLSNAHGQVMMLFTSDSLTNITSPLDVDSLFYWFAADVGVTTNNNKVTQWNDLSGNGYNVTQADTSKAPSFEATGGPGSKPTMTFDGTNDILVSASHWWGSDDITFFLVGKVANATRNSTDVFFSRFGGVTTSQFVIAGQALGLDYRMGWFGSDTGSSSASGEVWSYYYDPKETTYRLFSYWDGNTNLITGRGWYTNGSEVSLSEARSSEAKNGIYDYSQEFSIGARWVSGTPSNFLLGSISEIIVFSRALTATERLAIENYLNKKYDLY